MPAEVVERAARLGAVVRQNREGRGLSRETLARKAGLSVETLRKLEMGRGKSPELFTIVALSEALHVSIDDLVRA